MASLHLNLPFLPSSLPRLKSPIPIKPFFLVPYRPRRFLCSSSPPLSPPLLTAHQTPTPSDLDTSHTDDVVDSESSIVVDDVDDVTVTPLPKLESPELSVKEKKELLSYANGLGKKLKSQSVGKGGITATVAMAFAETLESKELLKLKVHGNCPGELRDVIKQLEEVTGSVAVGQIGRTVILYRPSLSKMKKKEAQSNRKIWRPKPKESSPPSGSENKWKVREHHRFRESSPTFRAGKNWKVRRDGQKQTSPA